MNQEEPDFRHATEMFKRVNEAYAVLSDPQKRSAYDSQIKQAYGSEGDDKLKRARNTEKHDTESMKQKPSDDFYWDPDFSFSSLFDKFENETLDSEENNRNQNYFRVLLCFDICLGLFFLYYVQHLDLSSVPKVYYYFGWSWLAHLEMAYYALMLSLLFSLVQLFNPLINRFSIFYSIFLRIRDINFWFLVIQFHLKSVIALWFVAPMFGIELFEMSGRVFFFACLWNSFMAITMMGVLISQR